jgi:hypothetical protein
MGTRQTSIDCYNQIKAQGLLSKQRFEVYEAICNSAPCTSSEAMRGRLNSTNVLSQSRARFTELRELGVIYEKGFKKCTLTGRNVIEWDLTDRLPIDKKITTTTKKMRASHTLYAFYELYKNRMSASSEEWENLEMLIRKI